MTKGLRLNTVMPIADSLEDTLKRLNDEAQSAGGKELWIDLKCRQLRVEGYWVPPYTEVKLSHTITVKTPVQAYFSDGRETATIVKVDGNRLIMLEGPRRVIGPGESVNIPDQSLTIDGYLTDTDKRYIEAGVKTGLRNYMLSFVEKEEDIAALGEYIPGANIVAKIESQKGMQYVQNEWNSSSRLMAARGDLYVELKLPHEVIDAVETIVRKDPQAIVASRIFNSLSASLEPSCADIGDVDNLMRMDYKTLMLGDDICMNRNSVVSGLNLLAAMREKYEK
jgi:pyruvate kinase